MQQEMTPPMDDKEFLSAYTLSSKTEQRSELAQELISDKPDILERWALFIFLLVLFVVIGVAWLIHYPDIIETRATLTTDNAPREFFSDREGKLTKVFVRHNQHVKKGQPIAWLASTVDHDTINALSFRVQKSIDLLTKNKQNTLPGLSGPDPGDLGEITPYYQQYLTARQAYGQISDARQKMILLQTLRSLKFEIDEWKRKFILTAPIEGKAFFLTPLQQDQYIHAAKVLGYIDPLAKSIFAQTTLSQVNFGKLDTGMTVQLRFDAYPYQEVGYVSGKLEEIAEISSENGFTAIIRLDSGLVTTDRYRIPFKHGLTAQAIIITKKTRLLKRLYYGFFNATSSVKK